LAQQVGPIAQIWREVYIVPEGRNQFQLNQPASRILQIVEEFPIPFTYLGNGVLVFSESMPAPPGVGIDQLGPLRADYLIEDLDGDGRFAEDPIDGQDNDGDGRIDEDAGGHWIVETGTTFAPDPALRQKLNLPAGVDTSFKRLSVAWLFPTSKQFRLSPMIGEINSLFHPSATFRQGFSFWSRNLTNLCQLTDEFVWLT